MKIPDKQEPQLIAFNHLSDIDFKDFIWMFTKNIEKPYSFLVTDTIFASDNGLRFRSNLLKKI